jgi:hypothetical protein
MAREHRGRGLGQMLAFGVCASSGAFGVAAINNHLYGSPAVSGYGDISSMFDVSHLWPNLGLYATWLMESQTIVGVGGALALVLPWRRLWPDPDHRRFLVIAGSAVGSVWTAYCLYLVFDAWWYLRFMLPVLPFIAIGAAAIAGAIRRTGGRATGAVVTIAVVLLGVLQFRFAVDNSVLDFWRGERRYVSVGRLVRAQTVENSVIISNQHSGSIRYYGGRMTLRFDNLDGTLLDEAIAWLHSRGVRPYLLVEKDEVPAFRERFAGQAALKFLDTPMSIYGGPGTAMLFDLVTPMRGEPVTIEDTLEGLRSVPPAPAPTIVLQPGPADSVR